MKITKRQLKRIINEEKARLVREMNPDGTISDDEDALQENFMADVEIQIDELIQYVLSTSEQIGGRYRGPGIRHEAFRMLAVKIQEMYLAR